jgi:hypothetical protein
MWKRLVQAVPVTVFTSIFTAIKSVVMKYIMHVTRKGNDEFVQNIRLEKLLCKDLSVSDTVMVKWLWNLHCVFNWLKLEFSVRLFFKTMTASRLHNKEFIRHTPVFEVLKEDLVMQLVTAVSYLVVR